MARDDRRQGAEDRPAAPDLHGLPGSRLRADRPALLVATWPEAIWTLTVRVGPKVERRRFDELEAALDELKDRVTALAETTSRDPATAKLRHYAPEDQVAARVELAGPQRLLPSTRAGVDVKGDGSTEAYLGRIRRTAIERRANEDAINALRRALSFQDR